MNPQARLGAFVLLALIMLAFATGKVGHLVWFKQDAHIVETEFSDLLGLEVQSPVLMAGVKVGTVQEILLHKNKALVRIALNPDIRLPASTRASIVGRGLVGEKNLVLTAKDGDTQWLADGTLIPSDAGSDINTFISKSSGITDDIRGLTETLSKALSDSGNGSSLQQMVRNISRAAEEVSGLLNENRQYIKQATRGFGKSGESVAELMKHHRRDLDQLLASLPKTTQAGQDFFTESTATMRTMHDMLIENRENLYRIMFELRKASENLEAFSDDIRRNPWKVLNEKPEVKASPRSTQLKMEEMLLTTGHMGRITADE